MNQKHLFFTVIALLFSTVSAYFLSDGPAHNTSTHIHETGNTANLHGRTLMVSPGDTLDIKSIGADLSYDVTRINAKAGSELTIRYSNDSDMPHNVIFVKTEADIQSVGIAALQAMDNDYIPMDKEDDMIAWTKLARPGETVYVTLTVPEPGTYPYICSYPGHFTMMQGRLVSTN